SSESDEQLVAVMAAPSRVLIWINGRTRRSVWAPERVQQASSHSEHYDGLPDGQVEVGMSSIGFNRLAHRTFMLIQTIAKPLPQRPGQYACPSQRLTSESL